MLTRADALREYLTGASTAGGAQTDPSLSLGNHRSSTPVVSLGIAIANAVTGAAVDFAGGENGEGVGTLTALDTATLVWTPPGEVSSGVAVPFSGTVTKLLEGLGKPGKFIRVTGTPPFSVGSAQVTLSHLYESFHGGDNLAAADAAAGITQYRASMLRNDAAFDVLAVKRFVSPLGTPVTSNTGWLSGSGAGSVTTSGSLADWPERGYAQVRSSGGTLKEVVYYSGRTATVLTVPASGRGLLGTSATAGANTDAITPVPGVAIAVDPEGVVAGTEAIQTAASQTTAPTGVTWNLGITAATGLQIGDMAPGEQVGVWVRRHTPAGMVASPKQLIRVSDQFTSF